MSGVDWNIKLTGANMRGCSILWAVMRVALTASNAMPQAKINPFVLPHEVGLFVNQLQCCIRQNKRHGNDQCQAKDQCSRTRARPGHIIKELEPTAKRPIAKITHTPDKMNPQEHGTKVCKQCKREKKR